MGQGLRRLRGAIGMGLTWGIAWALGGVLIGVLSTLGPAPFWDAVFRVFDAPLPALAIPGFVGGVLFSLVLGVAGRRRRFEELSLPRFAAWGAFGGLLLALVPTVMVLLGLAHLGRPEASLLWLTAVTGVPFMALSAASAAGTLWLARKAQGRELPTGPDQDRLGA